jgi:hypothetical protein
MGEHDPNADANSHPHTDSHAFTISNAERLTFAQRFSGLIASADIRFSAPDRIPRGEPDIDAITSSERDPIALCISSR